MSWGPVRLGLTFGGVLDSDFSRLDGGGGEGSVLTDGVSGGGLTSSKSSSLTSEVVVSDMVAIV